MAYTSHGRHIPGTLKAEGEVAGSIACPGIEDCRRCKGEIEASQHHQFMVGSHVDYQEIAKILVREYVEGSHRKIFSKLPDPEFTVYIITFSKTLQNWKALLGTTLPDGKVYELTHDGDKNTTYFDVYGKITNFAVTHG